MSSPTTELQNKVRALPHKPGVYIMKDRLGKVLYVGKAKELKKRVSTYFQPARRRQLQQPKVVAMIPLIYSFDYIVVQSEAEALLLEGKLIKQWKPKYNTDFVDDKRFLLVRVDMKSDLPKFSLTRFKKDGYSRYFGPFAQAGMLKKTLAELRKSHGILLADANPKKLADGRYQLYTDVRADMSAHENVVTVEEYKTRVEEACKFLEGRCKDYLDELKEKMKAAAENLQFERAAEYRDIWEALRRTVAKSRKFVRDPQVYLAGEELLAETKQVLGMKTLPTRMECFDISHISGSFVVASMVHFYKGRPLKKEYRRYKIRDHVGNDDFRSMNEVIGRRYERLHKEERPFPDLIVIDGGLGQVNAAQFAFVQLGISSPFMIGLAKREETIIFANGREPLLLPPHHGVVRLLQRIRDEAHRFANTFNADLRSEKIRESILDDFSGLGEKRKELLLTHFGSLAKLKKASVDELQAVPGIGQVFAERLKEFLENY